MTDVKKPISIYIHIPFCVKKCNYCDFLSSPCSEDERSIYIERLIDEIKATKAADKYEVQTVFFGGGTPSLLKVDQIEKILCKLREVYSFADKTEITIECNPGTVDIEKLTGYKKLGINRLSIGAQSFDDEELRLLGRIHNSAQIVDAVRFSRTAGFENISIDIISSIPSQSVKSYEQTIRKALDLQCEHYSVYSLIIEPGTPFYVNQNKLNLPTEDEVILMDEITKTALEAAGYEQYEISNYARPGLECKHNITYWKRGLYRGYGLGAASLVLDDCGREIRFSAERKLADYYADANLLLEERKNCEEYMVLSREDIISEYVFLGLRMNEGIDISLHEKIYSETIEKHINAGLCEYYNDGTKRLYRLSHRGMQLANVVMSDYLL